MYTSLLEAGDTRMWMQLRQRLSSWMPWKMACTCYFVAGVSVSLCDKAPVTGVLASLCDWCVLLTLRQSVKRQQHLWPTGDLRPQALHMLPQSMRHI